jgi:cell division protein FtsB
VKYFLLVAALLVAGLICLQRYEVAVHADDAAAITRDFNAYNAERKAENDALGRKNEQLRQEIKALQGK